MVFSNIPNLDGSLHNHHTQRTEGSLELALTNHRHHCVLHVRIHSNNFGRNWCHVPTCDSVIKLAMRVNI
jgi:hypothetical protein